MKKHETYERLGVRAAARAMVLLGLAVASAEAQDIGKSQGQVFPDFELPTIDGEQTIRLSGLRGKHVLLIEFASW